MIILKFILFIGLLSQIYAQLDPFYWRLQHPYSFTDARVLEVRPSTLVQMQFGWNNNYWQHWIIYWLDKPNRVAIVFDRYNYRALTAVNGKLEAKEIYSKNDSRSDTQYWHNINSAIGERWIFTAPNSLAIEIPWIVNSGPSPNFLQLSALNEVLDPTKHYKILGWSNPLRSLDLASFVPYVWATYNDYNNFHQRFVLTQGTCNGQTAYQIANANNRYLIAGGKNTVLTLAVTSGKSPAAENSVTWWFLNKEPDYYNMAYTISNCEFTERYLTLPNDVNTDGKEFTLKEKGAQGLFFLRKIV